MDIFIDSDVIISSLLSKTGAAYILLHTDTINPLLSSISQKEIEIVIARLDINKNIFIDLLRENLKVVPLLTSNNDIKKKFQEFVLDINDAHIVAGAKEANVRFIITYNLKDFKIERIKDNYNIIVLTPGQFLQYLRSRK